MELLFLIFSLLAIFDILKLFAFITLTKMHLREEKKKKLAPAIKDMLSDLVLSLLRIKQRIILLLCAVFVCLLICLFIYLFKGIGSRDCRGRQVLQSAVGKLETQECWRCSPSPSLKAWEQGELMV